MHAIAGVSLGFNYVQSRNLTKLCYIVPILTHQEWNLLDWHFSKLWPRCHFNFQFQLNKFIALKFVANYIKMIDADNRQLKRQEIKIINDFWYEICIIVVLYLSKIAQKLSNSIASWKLIPTLNILFCSSTWRRSATASFDDCPILDQLLRHLKCAFLYIYDGPIFDGSHWSKLDSIWLSISNGPIFDITSFLFMNHSEP